MAALPVKSKLPDKRFKNIQSCDVKQILDKTLHGYAPKMSCKLFNVF